jgi:hypothetical protein
LLLGAWHCTAVVAGTDISGNRKSLAMEYMQFIVQAFEREPGKWRASVERANGKAIMITTNRRQLAKFVTGVDAKSAQAAILMAMAAIDAGAFSKVSSNRRR